MVKYGKLITFEGPEGSGKSTQIKLLANYLSGAGSEVVVTREPGGTPLAEHFREILKHHHTQEKIHPSTELFLFEAGRAQNVNEVIKPALAAGKIVLCDRFTDSTIAYQGYARGQDLHMLETLNRLALNGVEIALTILLDLPPEVGFARAARRVETQNSFDRMESETLAFHHKVRSGFLALAAQYPERIKIFNAEQPKEQLAAAIAREAADVVGI